MTTTPHAPEPTSGAPPPDTDAEPTSGVLRPDTDLTLPAGESTVVTTDDGARLAVTIAGGATATAPTVVLPHCWTGSRAMGVPVARRLVAAGHRVVLYDQRGHGESTLGREPISIGRLGDDLGAVLAELEVAGAVLAGHSMGGMTVMGHACRHPGQVRARARGLVLVATAAHGLAHRQPVLSLAMRGIPVERLMARPRLGHALVRGTFGLDPQPDHVEATRAHFAGTRPEVWRACLAAMRDMDLRYSLRAVDLPAVVVLGRRDRLVPNSLTRAIAEHLAGAEVVELPGAGHMLPLERPDEVAEVIRRVAS